MNKEERKRAERLGYRLGRSIESKIGEKVFKTSLSQCKKALKISHGEKKWRKMASEEKDLLQSDCTVGAYKYLIKSFKKGIKR